MIGLQANQTSPVLQDTVYVPSDIKSKRSRRTKANIASIRDAIGELLEQDRPSNAAVARPPKPELPTRQLRIRQLVVRGRWAVASDGIQWILQRYQGGRWRDVSFVRSSKDILARCMREKGAAAAEMAPLLADLPDQFVEDDAPQTDLKAGSRRLDGQLKGFPTPSTKTAAAGGEQ